MLNDDDDKGGNRHSAPGHAYQDTKKCEIKMKLIIQETEKVEESLKLQSCREENMSELEFEALLQWRLLQEEKMTDHVLQRHSVYSSSNISDAISKSSLCSLS